MLCVSSCRYEGRREETNMVLINIKLLSGYVVDQRSLQLVSSQLDYLTRSNWEEWGVLTAGSAAAAAGRRLGKAGGCRRRIH